MIRELNGSGVAYQVAMVFITLPWGLRPLVAAISDKVPIHGWLKLYQTVFALLVGAIAAFTMFFVTTVNMAVAVLSTMSFAIMMIDMALEGEYISLMAYGKGSKEMPAFAWACTMAGITIAAVILGPVGDAGKTRFAVGTTFLCFLQFLPILSRNPLQVFPYGKRYLKLQSEIEHDLLNRKIRHKPITHSEWALCSSIFLVVLFLFMAFAIQQKFPWAAFAVACLLMVLPGTLLLSAYGKTDAAFAKLCFITFLSELLYVDIKGATHYWFTAGDTCVRNGPQFSLSFYLSVSTLVMGVAGMTMALSYKSTLGRFNYRHSIQLCTGILICAAIADVIMARRTNPKNTDGVLFLFGDAAVGPAASIARAICIQMLATEYVHKGKETTMYSILSGFQSMGSIISKILGLALMTEFSIKTRPPGCNFVYYSWLIVFAHMVLPLLTVSIAFITLPGNTYKSIKALK